MFYTMHGVFHSLVAASIGVTSDCVPGFTRLKSHADHVQFVMFSSVSRQHLQFSSVLKTFWHHLPYFRRTGPLDLLRSLRLLKQNNLQCGADHQLSCTQVLLRSSDQMHLVMQESSTCAILGNFDWLLHPVLDPIDGFSASLVQFVYLLQLGLCSTLSYDYQHNNTHQQVANIHQQSLYNCTAWKYFPCITHRLRL